MIITILAVELLPVKTYKMKRNVIYVILVFGMNKDLVLDVRVEIFYHMVIRMWFVQMI